MPVSPDSTAAADRSLGIGAVVGLLLALWSAAKGVKSLMSALDIVYHEPEARGFFKLNGTALLLTLAMLLVVPLSLAAVAVLPAVIDRLPDAHTSTIGLSLNFSNSFARSPSWPTGIWRASAM